MPNTHRTAIRPFIEPAIIDTLQNDRQVSAQKKQASASAIMRVGDKTYEITIVDHRKKLDSNIRALQEFDWQQIAFKVAHMMDKTNLLDTNPSFSSINKHSIAYACRDDLSDTRAIIHNTDLKSDYKDIVDYLKGKFKHMPKQNIVEQSETFSNPTFTPPSSAPQSPIMHPRRENRPEVEDDFLERSYSLLDSSNVSDTSTSSQDVEFQVVQTNSNSSTKPTVVAQTAIHEIFENMFGNESNIKIETDEKLDEDDFEELEKRLSSEDLSEDLKDLETNSIDAQALLNKVQEHSSDSSDTVENQTNSLNLSHEEPEHQSDSDDSLSSFNSDSAVSETHLGESAEESDSSETSNNPLDALLDNPQNPIDSLINNGIGDKGSLEHNLISSIKSANDMKLDAYTALNREMQSWAPTSEQYGSAFNLNTLEKAIQSLAQLQAQTDLKTKEMMSKLSNIESRLKAKDVSVQNWQGSDLLAELHTGKMIKLKDEEKQLTKDLRCKEDQLKELTSKEKEFRKIREDIKVAIYSLTELMNHSEAADSDIETAKQRISPTYKALGILIDQINEQRKNVQKEKEYLQDNGISKTTKAIKELKSETTTFLYSQERHLSRPDILYTENSEIIKEMSVSKYVVQNWIKWTRHPLFSLVIDVDLLLEFPDSEKTYSQLAESILKFMDKAWSLEVNAVKQLQDALSTVDQKDKQFFVDYTFALLSAANSLLVSGATQRQSKDLSSIASPKNSSKKSNSWLIGTEYSTNPKDIGIFRKDQADKFKNWYRTLKAAATAASSS